MTVAEISTLRRQLRTLDADYKVFKNTLVKRAIEGTSVASLDEFLVGPTAIAFVNGDVSAVAKALRDFSKATPTLIVKGGVLDGKLLSVSDPNGPRRTALARRAACSFRGRTGVSAFNVGWPLKGHPAKLRLRPLGLARLEGWRCCCSGCRTN